MTGSEQNLSATVTVHPESPSHTEGQILPLVLAGPILRRCTPSKLSFWLATSQPVAGRLTLSYGQGEVQHINPEQWRTGCQQIQGADHLWFQLVEITPGTPLPKDCWVGYELSFAPLKAIDQALESLTDDAFISWRHWAPDLVYPGQDTPGFVLKSQLSKLLHGSCRKPHHESGDGLWRADDELAASNPEDWPALLIMSGDQIYADDVAAPFLASIHRFIAQLGFAEEALPCSDVNSSGRLHGSNPYYYQREALLPDTEGGQAVTDLVFGGARKPVFTSDNAHNHLISLAEVLSMYLLVWSPAGWQNLSVPDVSELPQTLSPDQADTYSCESREVEHFVSGLGKVRRLMAHLPVAMIFDDHDITDDWNLTAAWEQTAYGHGFSRRIIGNALAGYLLCQGWGNAPEQLPDELMQLAARTLSSPGGHDHQQLIDELIRFPDWHYQWDTQPVLLVLDTRTHRWRSERSLDLPSGLMDWEALTDLQQRLIGHDAVVMVSPAPVFGVKLIEVIQRIFTWFGKPLMVDAENWMAHQGAAYALMNLFRHPKTPKNFVILSGDVHYSFVYDIELRGRERGPDIWQITSSGYKNEFPAKLLTFFDRFNRWLYSPKSPLNWFTKRRKMRVIPRKPQTADPGERLANGAGVGLVELNAEGAPVRVVQLCADGRDVSFKLQEDEARWE
ncbi:alkaline phosphatase D family protein [Oceanospirillum sp.]|uniref:alkaline phosphatase D family protein n=1 Tax=Oceanospirillum sp. TaxID=2021254 RepID=UPI003A8D7BFD